MNTRKGNILFSKYALLLLALVLFGISFFFNRVYTNRSSVKAESQRLENYLLDKKLDFDEFLKDTVLLKRLSRHEEDLTSFNRLAKKPYGIYLYQRREFDLPALVFWNQQHIVPSAQLIQEEKAELFSKEANGYYYIIRRKAGPNLLAIAMVLVRSDFFIETNYLQKKFTYSEEADYRVQIAEQKTDFPIHSSEGKPIFYLEKKTSRSVPYNDQWSILVRIIGLIIFLLFLHSLAESMAAGGENWKGIGFLGASLLFLRVLIYFNPGLLNLRQFELFDPAIYGSNPVQRSLGDLLFNAILFCWFALFAWSKLEKVKQLNEGLNRSASRLVSIVCLFLLVISSFVLTSVIRSLVADSKISFDVTDFFSLNSFTVVGFVVLALLSVAYYYFSQLLFRLIFPLFEKNYFLIYFAIGFAGLIYLSTRSGPDVLFYLPVLLWLMIYTWLINRQAAIFHKWHVNIASVLSWIFVFSISISVIMLNEIEKAEWIKRKKLAEKLALQTDPSSEKMMSIAIQYIDKDFLEDNFERFRDPVAGKELKDSILRGSFYLDKYDTRLYAFDYSGHGLNNEDPTSYESLNTILKVQSKPIPGIEGLYFYETGYDKFNYITRRDLQDSQGRSMGHFFILSNPKNYSKEAIFPELFRQYGNSGENSPIYSNATYAGGRLVSPPGNYPFATWLKPEELPRAEYEQRRNGEFDELWYKASNDRVIVVTRKRETFIETVTLFSYIFCSFLVLVGIVQLIGMLMKAVYEGQSMRRRFQLNIRSQVHSTIIFISVFSFLVIGAATISFFISRYNKSNSDKLSRTMKIMVNEMEKKLSEHNTFDDVVQIYDSVSNQALKDLVREVSEIHGVDVNVYDLEGNLQVSSEGLVYNKGVLSRKIDPTAYYHLNRLRQVQHAQEERVGNSSYLSIYSPVRDEKGVVYAYINIPYFTSRKELEQEISNFLVTIINLNAFIFLVAGLIALFITNRITRSFSLISERMREVNLGKKNEEIHWSRNDEIGELVLEYNKMVAKLGESALALAKSEREGAWREMARQVAHEIKNPLTPMKLSIQYLQKAINNNQSNVKELSANVANTLVEQIDHLSKIAADFSQFANIGTTHVELFDLHEVIGSLRDLYLSDEKVELVWFPTSEKMMLDADKTQMNRLFTNLFTNAVQACQFKSSCRIVVDEKTENNKAIITIEDNGEGIPVEMQDKIFVPNFTTKSSGTGLGLAMCKGIVEQAGGKIWFRTEAAVGTIFFIELPLATVQ